MDFQAVIDTYLERGVGGINQLLSQSDNIYRDFYIAKLVLKEHLQVDLPLTIDQLANEAQRIDQHKFRRHVSSRFQGRCVMTGCNIESVLEACHIVPYVESKCNDVANGLLLRCDIHRLFDAHTLTILPSGVVLAGPHVRLDASYAALPHMVHTITPDMHRFLDHHNQVYRAKNFE
jgi:predicted restriction endonuclease